MSQGDPFAANYYEAPQADLGRELPPVGEAGPAEVRLAAISEAWEFVKAKWGTWVGIIVVQTIISNLVVQGLTLLLIGATGPQGAANQRVSSNFLLFQGLIFLISLVMNAFFSAGIFRTAIKQVRGGQISVGDLFSAGDVTLSAIAGLILSSLAVGLGFVMLIVPGLYLAGRLMFVMPLVADGRLGGIEALKRSWEALRGQGWAALGFNIVAGLAAFLGVLACGVGLLVTLPIYFLSIAVLYRNFFRPEPLAA